jgi:hypothetical protein
VLSKQFLGQPQHWVTEISGGRPTWEKDKTSVRSLFRMEEIQSCPSWLTSQQKKGDFFYEQQMLKSKHVFTLLA